MDDVDYGTKFVLEAQILAIKQAASAIDVAAPNEILTTNTPVEDDDALVHCDAKFQPRHAY